MKRYAVLLACICLISPLISSADTISDLQAQVAALLIQIQQLQKQQTLPTTTSVPCPILIRNLRRGSRGLDVLALQQFLIEQDLLSLDSATGYFGALTERAVQRWQAQQGIVSSGSPSTTGYGSVGPRSRSILARCGISSTTLSGGGVSSPYVVTVPDTTSTQQTQSQAQQTTTLLPCFFNGTTIASGQSVIAYQSPAVPSEQTCNSETRTCTNGVLSGSNLYPTCTAQTPISNTNPPTVSLIASPTSIMFGKSATLTWTSTNATSCTGNGFTAPGTSGSTTVTPFVGTQTYSITCTGTGGLASASATVTVLGFSPSPTPTQPPSNQTLTQLYVSQANGSDTSDGSQSTPLKTIEAALQKVKASSLTSTDLTIMLMDTTYQMANGIDIDQSFVTNGNSLAITSNNQAGTTLTFGRSVTSQLTPYDRLLTYQFPNTGKPTGVFVDGTLAPVAGISTVTLTKNSPSSFTIQGQLSGDIASFPLTAVDRVEWLNYRCPVVSYVNHPSTSHVTINLDPDCRAYNLTWDTTGSYAINRILNLEGVQTFTSNGQWLYVGSSNLTLVYLSQSSEVAVVEGQHPYFFKLSGTAAEPVKNISFTNLRFDKGGYQSPVPYLAWRVGSYYTSYGQTTYSVVAGAIQIDHGQNISITNSAFHDLLGSGISLYGASSGIIIVGNTFSEIAGEAIVTANDPVFSHLSIQYNSISAIGKIFTDNPAIHVAYAGDSEIAYNNIDDLPYTGINVRSDPGHTPYPGVGNILIHDNTITNVMRQHNDGGGIHTIGDMPGTQIYKNTIGPLRPGYLTRGMLPGDRGFPIYIDSGGHVSVHDNVLQYIDWSALSKYVSPTNPIFGPNNPEANSPCGKTACNVTQYYNTIIN